MILIIDLYNGAPNNNIVNIKKIITRSGHAYKVIKTMARLSKIPIADVTGVILSGSPMRLTQPLNTHDIQTALYCLATFCDSLPILGICFGCQLMNLVNGGTITPFGNLVDGHFPTSTGTVVRFNFNDMLGKVAPSFKVLQTLTHRKKTIPCHIEKGNLIGYVFHPEEDLDKFNYIQRYLSLVKKV